MCGTRHKSPGKPRTGCGVSPAQAPAADSRGHGRSVGPSQPVGAPRRRVRLLSERQLVPDRQQVLPAAAGAALLDGDGGGRSRHMPAHPPDLHSARDLRQRRPDGGEIHTYIG